jgi:hypothetical protein
MKKLLENAEWCASGKFTSKALTLFNYAFLISPETCNTVGKSFTPDEINSINKMMEVNGYHSNISTLKQILGGFNASIVRGPLKDGKYSVSYQNVTNSQRNLLGLSKVY